jgi:acyl dehydratase
VRRDGDQEEPPVRAFPRERFSSEVRLTPDAVIEFANAAGDTNPIHHDPLFAATTRFGRPTASGPHTTALLLALTAAHFSKKGAMLGLEFWVRFRRAIYADERIFLEWLVVKVTPNEKFGGEVVELRGRILGQDGQTAVGAKGRVLVTERL